MQIKVLLLAVKDFNPESGDSAYTVRIVDLLLECVELSYRPGQLHGLYITVYPRGATMGIIHVTERFNLCLLCSPISKSCFFVYQ